MKTKTKRNLILLLIAALICAALFLLQHRLTRTLFNDTFVNGNTAGNLYNGGLFCESDGLIFFSNPADNHKLYSMTVSGTDVKKLCDDTVSYINADSHYIYYVRDNASDDSSFSFLKWNNNSLCRIKRTSGKVTVLDNDPSLYASLVGNDIFYIHYDTSEASTLYKVHIDGTQKQQVSTQPYFTCCANGSTLYYNGLKDDHNIYQYDTQTNSSTLLYEGNCWQPVVDGTTAYFLDCENSYALTKVDLSTQEKTVLVDKQIDCFNVYGTVIYYQTNDTEHPALCRIMTDGTGEEEIASGNYTGISVTSTYTYYYPFGDDTTCLRTPTTGTPAPASFVPVAD